ncbi:MAG TPA: hypothetical protein VN730_15390 [Steroidobacteraceae bacterium]|nr:hypothetical protein [Steroidobacteraceae bacterium]
MSRNAGVEAGADEVGLFKCLTLGAWLGTTRDRRNQTAILCWSILLAVGLVGSVALLKAGPGVSDALKWAVTAVTIALMIPWLWSQLRFLREADELIRKIQLEALAVGFWAGLAFGVAYSVLAQAGLPHLDPASGTPLIVAVSALGYASGRVLASKRYR